MTPLRSFTVRVFVVAVLLISPSGILRAQSNDARITGIVTDPSKAVIRDAKVDLVNVDTGVRYPAVTNGSGIYSVSGQVGNYRLEVEHVGFKTVIAPGIVLHTQDVLEINFEMAIGSASESVTVNAGETNGSPAVSMTVEREFIEDMPLNGRSLQDLIQLAPGTVSSSRGYSIDGQRTDSNNYTVDGVSSNLGGMLNDSLGVGNLSGSAPMQTVLGTTQSLASIDSLQEFTIQTSGYAAEYGRTPGGQVAFTTRSGTNDIHGTLFDYLRNTALDAKSYTENYFGQPKSAEHQNDFGGTIGGPLIIPKLHNGKDKTFFFFSYEGLRLLLPAFENEYVPTQAFRNWASPTVQPYLNAAPLPSPNSLGNQDGCTIPDPVSGQPTACDALFVYSYSYPNTLDNISLRLDQSFGSRFHAFVRFSDTPSSQSQGVESVQISSINTHTWTAGLTANITSSVVNDLRFNYSYDGEAQIETQKAVGGSIPLPRDLVIPADYDGPFARGVYFAQVPGTALQAQAVYLGGGTTQHQYQFIDDVAWIRAKHSLKFGVDWRRLTPTWASETYSSIIESQSLADIQDGYATSLRVSANAPGNPVFDNLSLYTQDHWKISPRLSLDYGVRWEFDPPPGPSNGHYPVTLNSSELATAELAPLGTAPYKSSYDHFAPRIGFAWNAIPSRNHPLTVRGGFGIFYDTGQTVIGYAYANAYPFEATNPTQTEVPMPLSSAVLAPPSLNAPLITPPYPFSQDLSDPDLTLPYTEQWNLSIDEALSAKNTLTVSYLGNGGRKLLFSQYYVSDPQGNPLFPNGLGFTNNASQSGYNAMQIQDTGRIADGLEMVASFTWAHARDNASNDESTFAPEWGNSDNDLRRVLNIALNYRTRNAGSAGRMRALSQGWVLANRFSTQSGSPLNVSGTYVTLPDGAFAAYFPDLVKGVPIYLHGRAADINGQPVPGSWRLNPAAFLAVPTDSNGVPIRQGTLGRNFLRDPPFWTLNTAAERSFPIYERLHLIFRVDAFNILNHPNLSNPNTYLPDASTFGQLNQGQIAQIGSSNPLYSMGAARSLQLSLKLQF